MELAVLGINAIATVTGKETVVLIEHALITKLGLISKTQLYQTEMNTITQNAPQKEYVTEKLEHVNALKASKGKDANA